jgi:hypothetical protein
MQLPEITIASQSLLKTGFRNANQVEVLLEVSSIGYGLGDAILDDYIVRDRALFVKSNYLRRKAMTPPILRGVLGFES